MVTAQNSRLKVPHPNPDEWTVIFPISPSYLMSTECLPLALLVMPVQGRDGLDKEPWSSYGSLSVTPMCDQPARTYKDVHEHTLILAKQ